LAAHRRSLKIFEKMGKSATEAPIVKPLSELVGTGGVTEGSGIYFGKIEDPTEVSHAFTLHEQWDGHFYIYNKVFLGNFEIGAYVLAGCGSESYYSNPDNGGGAFVVVSAKDYPIGEEIEDLEEIAGWYSRHDDGTYGLEAGVKESWINCEESSSRPLFLYEGLWATRYYGDNTQTAYARNRKGFYQIRGVKI